MQRISREIAEIDATKERAAIRRQEAMIGELAAMRLALQQAAEREAAAIERADAAEAREITATARADKRERFMVKLTAGSLVVGVISAVAAVVAIFA